MAERPLWEPLTCWVVKWRRGITPFNPLFILLNNGCPFSPWWFCRGQIAVRCDEVPLDASIRPWRCRETSRYCLTQVEAHKGSEDSFIIIDLAFPRRLPKLEVGQGGATRKQPEPTRSSYRSQKTRLFFLGEYPPLPFEVQICSYL